MLEIEGGGHTSLKHLLPKENASFIKKLTIKNILCLSVPLINQNEIAF